MNIIPSIALAASVVAIIHGVNQANRDPWWDILAGCGMILLGIIGTAVSLVFLFD